MNYIREINGFYDWLKYNTLSTGAIALWYALMSICNKAGWAEEFTVANVVLQSMTGLSRQGLDKARNQLIQKGVIEYKKGSGNQAGKYRLNSFECQIVDTNIDTKVALIDTKGVRECQIVDTNIDTKGAQIDTQKGHSSSTLYKLNKTKLNETINTTSTTSEPAEITIAKFIEQEFGQLVSGTLIERLKDWQKDFSDEMIKHAVSIAVLQNKKNFRYVEGILLDWLSKNIKTLEDVKHAEEEYRKNRQTQVSPKNNRRGVDNFKSKKRDLSYLVE